MTAVPIEDAYGAFAVAVKAALVTADFIAEDATVRIDPPEDLEPEGDPDTLITVAAIIQGDTKPVRTFIGGTAPRYAVEREVAVELGAAGPDRETREAAMQDALAALVAIGVTDADLSGAVERCEVVDLQSGELPPNGLKRTLTFVLRVRSGDPLGLTET